MCSDKNHANMHNPAYDRVALTGTILSRCICHALLFMLPAQPVHTTLQVPDSRYGPGLALQGLCYNNEKNY
jgi:hypothetical protein